MKLNEADPADRVIFLSSSGGLFVLLCFFVVVVSSLHRYSGRAGDSPHARGISMNSAVKQIITHELENRKIRSVREATVRKQGSLEEKVKDSAGGNGAGGNGSGPSKAAMAKSNHWLSRMKATVEQRQELKRTGGGTICRDHVYPMLYTFHEGVTNAVKRRVLLREIV